MRQAGGTGGNRNRVAGRGLDMRYFLVDRVTELVPGERARGVKAVTLSDEVLHDHFPDYPVMPGMLLLEGAAQLAGFLLEMSLNDADAPARRALLVQVRDAKFHRPVGPGSCVDLAATIESVLADAARVRTEVSVAGERVAAATLVFSMQLIDREAVHRQRRRLYQLWTRDLDTCPPII